jgi:hypothetical protein
MQNPWSGQDSQSRQRRGDASSAGSMYELANENWPKLLGFALGIIEM